jgi:sugar O-acyltransferase (sialic acid O-acetyltransferase NeuD family)
MKKLVLIGAGSYGREIYHWLPNCLGYGTEWEFKGFIDNSMTRLDSYQMGHHILALIKDYLPEPDDIFLCTIAEASWKKEYVNTISARGGQFCNLIHHKAEIGSTVKLGIGIFVAPFTVLTCDNIIGNHTTINAFSAVGHDCVIKDFCHINSFVLLGGGSRLGESVTIHPNSTIIPGKSVGDNSVVGAGSVVIKNVPPDVTVFGSPAVRLM